MAGGTYQPDHAGIQAFLTGPEVMAACRQVAEEGQTLAIMQASSFVVTGTYIGHFGVRTDIITIPTKYGPQPRAAAILENTSPHAAAVEWGNKKHPRAHHVLGQVLEILSNGA